MLDYVRATIDCFRTTVKYVRATFVYYRATIAYVRTTDANGRTTIFCFGAFKIKTKGYVFVVIPTLFQVLLPLTWNFKIRRSL